jgi:hypothetical protein
MKFREIVDIEWAFRRFDECEYRIQKEENGKWVTIYKEDYLRKRTLCDKIKNLFK